MSEHDQLHAAEETLNAIEQEAEAKRVKAIFDTIESKQLDFFDEAGKSVIERVATFLTVLFAVIALGSDFPPAYLKGDSHNFNRYCVIAILLCYLLALALAMLAIQPRRYRRYRYNLTQMSNELERILTYKRRMVQWAGIIFALGTVAITVLIISLVWFA